MTDRDRTDEYRRRAAFRLLQRPPRGMPVGDRTLGQENALDRWFAHGQLVDYLHPGDRALIEVVEDALRTRDALLAAGLSRPGTLLERFQHTLFVHGDQPAEALALRATYGVFGRDVETGLTWGDLRRLQEAVRQLAAQGHVDKELFE